MTQNLVVTSSTVDFENPLELLAEISRLEHELTSRRLVLRETQEAFRAFKIRYAQIVGARLAELEEVERAVKKAEAAMLGADNYLEDNELLEETEKTPAKWSGQVTLRKLFWSVAKLFHPDHALDESEARRRHSIMVEASRAYDEGDMESLHLLLDDENLRFHCRSGADTGKNSNAADSVDLRHQYLDLQEELRTVEFGIRRLNEDRLYQLKLKADEETLAGRDALLDSARQIERQIIKAKRRLEHLSVH